MTTTLKTGEINPAHYRKKYSRDDLEALARSKNAIDTDSLATMLKAHGFQETNIKSSNPHRTFKNPHTHETVLLAPHHKSNDPSINNRDVANACLKVRDWVRKQEEEEALAFAIQLEFTEKAKHPQPKNAPEKIRVIDNLPEDITGHEIEGKWILRHREQPYIGAHLIEEHMPAYHRDAYITSIRSRAESFKAELEAAYELLEIESEIQDGTLKVTMNPYEVTLDLPPFESELDRPSLRLKEMIDHVQKIDDCQIEAFARLLGSYEKAGGKRVLATSTRPNAQTHEIKAQSYIRPELKEWIPINVSPKGRPYIMEIPAFRDRIFKALFNCGAGRNLIDHNFMKKNFGLVLRQNGIEDGHPTLRITHPFYEDIDLTLPDPNKIPTFEDVIKEKTSTTYEQIDQLRVQVRDCLWKTRQLLEEKTRKSLEASNGIYETLLHPPYQQNSSAIRLAKEGDVTVQSFTNTETGSSIKIRIVKLAGSERRTYAFHAHPDDIESARRYIAEENQIRALEIANQLRFDNPSGRNDGICDAFQRTNAPPDSKRLPPSFADTLRARRIDHPHPLPEAI